MSEEFFERSERDSDDGMRPPDLGPLRAAAEREELAEAQGRLADGLGNPLPPSHPHAPLARDVARALTEAGFTLHDCVRYRPQYRAGGVCLLPVTAGHTLDGQSGVAVSWTTHDLLALDCARGAERQGTQQTMNRALARVLTALGYQVEPFGTGDASLVTSPRRPSTTTARRSGAGRRPR